MMLKEHFRLIQLYKTTSDLKWSLAHVRSKDNGLKMPPKSALLTRTTKELLERDLFNKQNKGIEGFVTLVAQRRVARAKSNESSDQQENSY